MLLFALPLALLLILVILAIALAAAWIAAIRRALVLRRAEFQIAPEALRPGEGLRAWARVVPRAGRPLKVRAVLTCTLLDHRARVLYANAHELAPVHGRDGEQVAFVQVPPYALRSGAVGAELGQLFSEDAYRLLVAWSVEFEVRPADRPERVLARASIPVELPEGRPLGASRAEAEQALVATCAAMQADLVFNWLVQLAAADGQVDPRERAMLHDVLRARFGVSDPAAAEARVAVEQQRALSVDPTILRKHVPEEARAALYRFLYAMAWRDGRLDERERAFLARVLDRFGLDEARLRALEEEEAAHAAPRAYA